MHKTLIAHICAIFLKNYWIQFKLKMLNTSRFQMQTSITVCITRSLPWIYEDWESKYDARWIMRMCGLIMPKSGIDYDSEGDIAILDPQFNKVSVSHQCTFHFWKKKITEYTTGSLTKHLMVNQTSYLEIAKKATKKN